MKDSNVSRSKFLSVVIQPKLNSKVWLDCESADIFTNLLLGCSFPLYTEIRYALENLEGLTANTSKSVKAKVWAFGTETSVDTKIPHYQIYLEFDKLVRNSSVYQALDVLLANRAHIVTKKVYNCQYKNYCLKNSSNFNFDSKYYWNTKLSSDNLKEVKPNLLSLRPNLKMVQKNLMTGQELLKKIITSEPDDRTGIWLADVLGNTGKTVFFQSQIEDAEINGLYLRVTEGVERLSAKLRKKINDRLESGKGYPKTIWINFGRTVEEGSLKAFSDFAEQILDGMLDDNFGNTGTGDFVPLPYVNLVVTANTPPNLNQLTGDRLKLMTLFPVKDESGKLVDSFLLPVFVKISVRILKAFPNNLEYQFTVIPESFEFYADKYKDFHWFMDLVENVTRFEEFKSTPEYERQKYESKLISQWVSTTTYNLQSDILSVYYKALAYSTTVSGRGSNQKFIEASSLNKSDFKVYSVKDALRIVS